MNKNNLKNKGYVLKIEDAKNKKVLVIKSIDFKILEIKEDTTIGLVYPLSTLEVEDIYITKRKGLDETDTRIVLYDFISGLLTNAYEFGIEECEKRHQ